MEARESEKVRNSEYLSLNVEVLNPQGKRSE